MTPSPAALNVLIVDDEPTACNNLKKILGRVAPDIGIAGIAHNTREAAAQIDRQRPDALFLDIEMPGEHAFPFLERIYPFSFEIIFVTAYDAYAVRAFRLHAIDYILKPAGEVELRHATDRLRDKIACKQLLQHRENEYRPLLTQMRDRQEHRRIFLREQNQTTAIDFNDIYYIEAMGSYARIYFRDGAAERQIIMSHSIAEYEELLPSGQFFRTHKSYLINGIHLKHIIREEQAGVILAGRYRIPVSRRRLPELLQFISTCDLPKA